VAQALNVLASPILTRLYDPEAFGVFALFVTIVSIAGIAVTGRYEQAIVLPDNEKDAASLLGLTFLLTIAATAAALVLVWLGGDILTGWLGAPALAPWLWFAPFFLFALGVYNGLNYWSTRHNQFRRLSISQMFRGGGTIGSQLALALGRGGPFGLIGGKVIGQALATAVLFWQIWRQDGDKLRQLITWERLRPLARRHQDFPRYGMPQALLNALSVSVFALLMTPFFGPAVVGYYALTQKVLALPARLLGESIRQVFFPKASEIMQSGGDAYRFLRTTTLGMLAVGFIPTAVIFLFGPQLFAFIFGADWYQAGVYARLIIPWTYMALANPPSVMMMPLLNKQNVYLRYEIIALISRIAAILLGVTLGDDVTAVAIFSAVGFLLNAGLILYVFRLTRMTLMK
jgi:O-antigen/teichoic acid export membrane protein